ncbi:response regulator transcription factor [Leucobacter weissii]|uniref:Response regulator transcription factor n=1 Tax=Leucobacter weissii TaxID=1983706 RepID=A0A939MKY4_9MICO|nr:response regulator transcription factor [Leucobacter weissii]MBO1902491.1 response regulator transcription factor [Leucobacter weissii]
MSIDILVVDDQPMYRVGVSAIVNAHPGMSVIGEASNGREAIEQARTLWPDVILMDIRMPEMNGIDATRAITTAPFAHEPPPAVIMLTTFDLDDYVYEALRAGASGFLLKDSGGENLISAIHTVHDGDALLAPRITRRLIEHFVESSPGPLQPQTVFDDLTDREREVFEQMARGRSNLEISRALHVAEQTAKTHVSRVMTKLGLRDRVHAVVLAYETGLVRAGDLHATEQSATSRHLRHPGGQR